MHVHTHQMPKAALVAGAALIGFSLVAAGLGRIGGIGTVSLPEAAAVESRALRFEDRPDGSVAVLDPDGTQVSSIAPGGNGFLRGTLRGLARERKLHGLGSEQPFVLTRRADGLLALEDPATGRRIELGAFGPDNAAAFVRLLTPQTADRPAQEVP